MELVLRDDEGKVVQVFPFGFPTKEEWEENLNPEISEFGSPYAFFELKIDYYADFNDNAERQGAYFRRVGKYDTYGRVDFEDESKFDSGGYLEDIEDRQPEEEEEQAGQEESADATSEMEDYRKQLKSFQRNARGRKFKPCRELAKQLLELSDEDLKKWIEENNADNYLIYAYQKATK